MADFDIGDPCINRTSQFSSGSTIILKGNPADAAGKITKVFIWPKDNITATEVATFYETNGNTFSTRDTELIGDVEAGAAREFAVNLDVETGDYIGMYYSTGYMERSLSGGAGLWYCSGDNIPCDEMLFPFTASNLLSLYGEGELLAVKKTLVQAALISIPPLVVLPTLGQILRFAGGC